MTTILRDLKQYVRNKFHGALPPVEMLERMMERVEEKGIDERELIFTALRTLEQVESDQQHSELEIATRDRRRLIKYFDGALELAVAKRDALEIVRLKRLKKLINEPPSTTRKIDSTTIDSLLKVYVAMHENPRFNFKEAVIHVYGDTSEYERLKKANQRHMKRLKEEK